MASAVQSPEGGAPPGTYALVGHALPAATRPANIVHAADAAATDVGLLATYVMCSVQEARTSLVKALMQLAMASARDERAPAAAGASGPTAAGSEARPAAAGSASLAVAGCVDAASPSASAARRPPKMVATESASRFIGYSISSVWPEKRRKSKSPQELEDRVSSSGCPKTPYVVSVVTAVCIKIADLSCLANVAVEYENEYLK